jgi:2-C-methyl-D-erythritol 4-phosphate cytidylyltransferase / 2-C-methyl-D-erythritol 2,4-cyclodiphosphate synthase
VSGLQKRMSPETAKTPLVDNPAWHAIVPAAGAGRRLGLAIPKQYLLLDERCILQWTVDTLCSAEWINSIMVVVAPDDHIAAGLLRTHPRVQLCKVGGPTRRDSVRNALDCLQNVNENDWVLVQDAARPGLTLEMLQRLRQGILNDEVGGLLAIPVADTVKRHRLQGASVAEPVAEQRYRSAGTVDRDGLWLAQTPQVFRRGLLQRALDHYPSATDEASAVEALGQQPLLIQGARENFKVTTVEDYVLMRALLTTKTVKPALRIGQGYDVHALVPGRRLILGGVEIASDLGLLGHSDADVLTHALIDALLGAAALGDIGSHYPDTDPRFAGADSLKLLGETLTKVLAAGYRPVNIDATLIAQAPRLAPYIEAITANLCRVTAMPSGSINVKAKTNERLGFEGRSEGIVAQVVVLIELMTGIESKLTTDLKPGL